MSHPFSPLAEGFLLQGRYRIKRLIGQGGMGAVYEALENHLGNLLAIKQNFYGEDERLKRAFEHEARLLANLRHESLPRVTHYFTEDFGQFLVMEFIAGDDLMTLLQRRGSPFHVEQVLTWASQLLDVLQYLHSQTPPIIHRDIKPQNLKLNDGGKIMLLDFGLAKGTTAGLTSLMVGSSLMGFTPGYAPLEQMTGKGTDGRSDLYALAATLYHLLTNQAPIDASLRSGAVALGDYDPLTPAHQINPAVPMELSNLLLRTMAHKPDQRPRDAAEMREAIKRLRLGEGAGEIHGHNTVFGSKPTENLYSKHVGEIPNDLNLIEANRNASSPSNHPDYRTRPMPQWPGAVDLARQTPNRHPGEFPAVIYTAPKAGQLQVPPAKSRKLMWWIISFVIVFTILSAGLSIWVNRNKINGANQNGPPQAVGQTAERKTSDSAGEGQIKQPQTAKQPVETETGLSIQYVSVDLGGGVKAELAPIPAGRFIMGGDLPDDGKPMHPVKISKAFYLGKYSVTQAQWQAVMHNNPSHFSDCGPNCPVENVSWNDAEEFIKELNARQHEYTFRLPTEAEWEYSARAGTVTEYPGKLDEIAWWKDNSGNKTHAVGQKKPNAWGLYDMNGNVIQWVQDKANYDEYDYRSVTAIDPTGPTTGNERRARGGSWSSYSNQCSSAFRGGWIPTGRDSNLGFRLAADRR